MNIISRTKKDFKDFIGRPTEDLGRWGRFLVFQLRVWPMCVKLLLRNRAGQQSAALAYHTLFGIVPLAIVVLMVFQMIPGTTDIGREVRSFIYEQANLTDIKLQLGEDGSPVVLTDKINELTEGFMEGLNKGLLTLFSGAIVILAALGLLITIEKAFNHIWHVTKGRDMIQRIINYWALLTLGPLLLGLGIFAGTRMLFLQAGLYQQVMDYLQPVIGFVISLVAMFLLYKMMPNTHVHYRAALYGAAVASLLWSLAKWGFGMYITQTVVYSKVYGVIGLIPLGVLWVYITWMIVLFGLQLTYTTQHLQRLTSEELRDVQHGGEYFMINDFAIIRMLEYIMDEFEHKRAPVMPQAVCRRLKLPREFGEDVLEHLVDQGLLLKTSDPYEGYAPATDGGNITLREIAEASLRGSFVQREIDRPGKLKDIMDDYHRQLARHTLDDILSRDAESLSAHRMPEPGPEEGTQAPSNADAPGAPDEQPDEKPPQSSDRTAS